MGAVMVAVLLLDGVVLGLLGLRWTVLLLDGAVLALLGLWWTALRLDGVVFEWSDACI